MSDYKDKDDNPTAQNEQQNIDQLASQKEQKLKDKKDESDDNQGSDSDSDDEPRFIKIIKDDTKTDEGMDNETRARLLSNVKDDIVKTGRKMSESDIVSNEGQQEKDLRKFEAEKENRIKKIISDKKVTTQKQRDRIDVLRRVTDLFFDKKRAITPTTNNQQRLVATGLTANDVTVKDKELKHKILEQKHHFGHHDSNHNDANHHAHGSKLSFADLVKLQQHNHNNEGGGRSL